MSSAVFENQLSANQMVLINQLEGKKFGQLSSRILANQPISDSGASLFSADERQRLVGAFGLGSQNELSHLLTASVQFWAAVTFRQPTSASLSSSLTSNGFSEAIAASAAEAWQRDGPTAIEALKSIAHTTRLRDVKWSLRVDASSRRRARINEPMGCVELQLEDAAGNAEKVGLELDHEQLDALFNDLEDVQKEVDKLMA